jgi:hypothetical protein
MHPAFYMLSSVVSAIFTNNLKFKYRFLMAAKLFCILQKIIKSSIDLKYLIILAIIGVGWATMKWGFNYW